MTKLPPVKTCFHCQTSQPLAAFAPSPNSRSPDKLGMLCATCRFLLSPKEKARLETAFWRANKAQARAGDAKPESESSEEPLALRTRSR